MFTQKIEGKVGVIKADANKVAGAALAVATAAALTASPLDARAGEWSGSVKTEVSTDQIYPTGEIAKSGAFLNISPSVTYTFDGGDDTLSLTGNFGSSLENVDKITKADVMVCGEHTERGLLGNSPVGPDLSMELCVEAYTQANNAAAFLTVQTKHVGFSVFEGNLKHGGALGGEAFIKWDVPMGNSEVLGDGLNLNVKLAAGADSDFESPNARAKLELNNKDGWALTGYAFQREGEGLDTSIVVSKKWNF